MNFRIFVNPEDNADCILNQIKRIYPSIKAEHDIVEIQVTLKRGCDPQIIEQIGTRVIQEDIIEFRDRIFFDSI